MNRWDCERADCTRYVVGVYGAIGLRAVGWYVGFGEAPSGAPAIYCPTHRPDPIICRDDHENTHCTICQADKTAKAIQDKLYTADDRAVLDALANRRLRQVEPCD